MSSSRSLKRKVDDDDEFDDILDEDTTPTMSKRQKKLNDLRDKGQEPGVNDKPKGRVKRAANGDLMWWSPDEETWNFARAVGTAGPDDVTSFHAGHKTWGPDYKHWPEILKQNDPIKDTRANANPEIWVDSGKIVLCADNHPLKVIPELPQTCSSKLEDYEIDAIRRLNTRITFCDLYARMPPMPPKDPSQNVRSGWGPNALSMRAQRFRHTWAITCLVHRKGTKEKNAVIESLYPPGYLESDFRKDFQLRVTKEALERVRNVNKGNHGHLRGGKMDEAKKARMRQMEEAVADFGGSPQPDRASVRPIQKRSVRKSRGENYTTGALATDLVQNFRPVKRSWSEEDDKFVKPRSSKRARGAPIELNKNESSARSGNPHATAKYLGGFPNQFVQENALGISVPCNSQGAVRIEHNLGFSTRPQTQYVGVPRSQLYGGGIRAPSAQGAKLIRNTHGRHGQSNPNMNGLHRYVKTEPEIEPWQTMTDVIEAANNSTGTTGIDSLRNGHEYNGDQNTTAASYFSSRNDDIRDEYARGNHTNTRRDMLPSTLQSREKYLAGENQSNDSNGQTRSNIPDPLFLGVNSIRYDFKDIGSEANAQGETNDVHFGNHGLGNPNVALGGSVGRTSLYEIQPLGQDHGREASVADSHPPYNEYPMGFYSNSPAVYQPDSSENSWDAQALTETAGSYAGRVDQEVEENPLLNTTLSENEEQNESEEINTPDASFNEPHSDSNNEQGEENLSGPPFLSDEQPNKEAEGDTLDDCFTGIFDLDSASSDPSDLIWSAQV
ncbi:hypothetical protein MMC13_007348 [Lambiella insularis]|nr:hypothetical protein [Lambiella insularis]